MSRRDQRITQPQNLPSHFERISPSEIRINAWLLERPPAEYFAEACSFDIRNGLPTIYFAQLSPGGRVMTVLAVTMPERRARDVLRECGEISARLAHVSPTPTAPVVVDIDAISHEQYRQFAATIVRIAVDDDWGFIDFYNVEAVVPQQLAQNILPQIWGSVRVVLAPALMQQLLQAMSTRFDHEPSVR